MLKVYKLISRFNLFYSNLISWPILNFLFLLHFHISCTQGMYGFTEENKTICFSCLSINFDIFIQLQISMSVLLTHVRMVVNARMESIDTCVFVPQAGLEPSANRVSIRLILYPLLPPKKQSIVCLILFHFEILQRQFHELLFLNLNWLQKWQLVVL